MNPKVVLPVSEKNARISTSSSRKEKKSMKIFHNLFAPLTARNKMFASTIFIRSTATLENACANINTPKPGQYAHSIRHVHMDFRALR